jgi:hypothetical protein
MMRVAQDIVTAPRAVGGRIRGQDALFTLYPKEFREFSESLLISCPVPTSYNRRNRVSTIGTTTCSTASTPFG